MEPFRELTSIAAPLPLNDVDTDMIIPAQFLTSVSREGYGQNLFKRLRESDPNFFLNQPRYAEAKVLIAGSNFGCGSSREHAVWALCGAGIRVVIAKSFADIFSGNSAKNGLLLVQLPAEAVDELLTRAAAGECRLEVSLEKQEVRDDRGVSWSFSYDPFRKHCLLQGLDDIDYIRAAGDEIAAFRARQASTRFFSTLGSGDAQKS